MIGIKIAFNKQNQNPICNINLLLPLCKIKVRPNMKLVANMGPSVESSSPKRTKTMIKWLKKDPNRIKTKLSKHKQGPKSGFPTLKVQTRIALLPKGYIMLKIRFLNPK